MTGCWSAGRLRRRPGGDARSCETLPMTRQASAVGGPSAGGRMCATDAPRRCGAVGSPTRRRYLPRATSTTLAAGSPSATWRPPSPQALEHSRATARAGGVGSESGAASRALTTPVRSGAARCARSRSTGTLAREPAGTAIMPATQIPISAASARPHQSRLTPTKVANRPQTRQREVALSRLDPTDCACTSDR